MHLVHKMRARRCKPWEPICQLGKVNSLNKFAKYFSSPPQILNVSPHLHQILGGPPNKYLFWNKMKTLMMGTLWHVEPPALIEEVVAQILRGTGGKYLAWRTAASMYNQSTSNWPREKNRASRQRKVTRPMITKSKLLILCRWFQECTQDVLQNWFL